MTHDPTRLLDDLNAPAGLRRDLAASAQHRLPYDVSAGAARFEAKLTQGAGAASSGWGAAGALGFGALILGGLVTALAVRAPEQAPAPTPAPSHAPALAAREAAAQALPRVEAALPVEHGSEDPHGHVPADTVPEVMDEEPAPAPGASRPGKPPRTRARRPAPAPTDAPAPLPAGTDYLREAKSLQAARGLLGRDPAGALGRAEAGAREFAGGAFVQEWEGVAILALFELGRAEAEARAQGFLARYPKGPYSVQVREAAERR